MPGSLQSDVLEGQGPENFLSVMREGRIAVVVVDRPPVNALSFDSYDAIRDMFTRLGNDSSLSVIVLTGAGKRAFVAGHDVNEFVKLTPESATRDLARVRAAFDAVQDCPIPVIAVVNGAAIGAGLALASLADIRLASADAVFALPEIDVGVIGSASHLMRLVPQGLVRMMALTGRRLSAEDARQAGLVEEVYPPDRIMEAGMDLAREIADKSPAALRLMKVGLNKVEELSVKAGYEYECTLTAEVRHGPDAGEGALSVLEKRPPRYTSLESPSN